MFGDILEESIENIEKRYLMHLDLDYFYAAIEIRANPELKGKKLIVGNKNARTTRKGVVLTCSYETRVYGVRSGMSMHEALTRCPDAVISNDARKEYRPTSKRIMKFLKSLNIQIAITSVDEAYLDLTNIVSSYEEAYYFGKYVQSKIYEIEKITCSVGIGPTLKVAKMASEFNKPVGLTVVRPHQLYLFFKDQKLTNIPGIGKKTGSRLREKGYTVCSQLLSKTEGDLIDLFGEWGSYLWKLFRGKTSNQIKKRGSRKSISHERTFHGKPLEYEKYYQYLQNLFQKTLKQLKSDNFVARTIGVKIRYNGFATITRSYSLTAPTDNYDQLYDAVEAIARKYFNDPRGIRLLGVKFSNLTKKENNQIHLINFFN